MNKAVVGAAALVVVVGAGTGFAAWSGAKVAGELQAKTGEFLAPFGGVKVIENRVDKGLFSSLHTVTIEVGCGPEADAAATAVPAADDGTEARKPTRITWRHRIAHGPLPGGKAVGLATIDSEIVLPPEVAAQIAKVAGDKALLTIHTTLGFGGSYVTDITSPPLQFAEADKGEFNWQGLRATVRGSLAGGMAAGGTYTMEAPGLDVKFQTPGQQGAMQVGRMTMEGEVLPHAGNALWMAPSRGTARVASMSFTLPQAGQAEPTRVVFDDLTLSSDAKIDDAGLWSAVSKMSTKGRVGEFAIDKVDMQVSLNRIHAATYEALISKAMQSSFSCKKDGDVEAAVALAADMEKGFGTLLTHNPEYALDRLAVELGGQTAELSYSFGTKGVTEADAALPLPALLGTKAYGNASFKVQNGWIEKVVKQMVALKAQGDAAAAEEATTGTLAFVNASIDDMVAKGFAVREGDVVRSKAVFEGGMLKVNDQPLNLPIGAMMGR